MSEDTSTIIKQIGVCVCSRMFIHACVCINYVCICTHLCARVHVLESMLMGGFLFICVRANACIFLCLYVPV